MKLGILVTISNGFGKKGFYLSQEIGLGRRLHAGGHEVTVYKCVPHTSPEEWESLDMGLSIHYIPTRSLGVHGYLPAHTIDPGLDALVAFADTQIFLPHIIRFCERNGICFIPYVGLAHSTQRKPRSQLMDAAFAHSTLKHYRNRPVLAKTPTVIRELQALGVKRCRLAPVGLDPVELKVDFRSEDRQALRAEYGYADDDTVVSFVGRLEPEKRPLDCLQIVARLAQRFPHRRYRLLVVGDGSQRPAVDRAVADLGLSGMVTIIECIPHEDIWKIHYISDYIVNCCDHEIFGMALMEGVFYESSAAAVHAPGPDFILEGLAGHALCSGADDIERWIAEGNPSPSDLRASSEYLLKRFSWDRCANEIEDIARAHEEHARPLSKRAG